MEDSGSDPYRYPGSSVLKNRLGLRDQAELDAFEALITAQRGEEPLPRGVLSFAHYRAIHHHLFQDVFEWAGKCRTVHIAKGGNMFCSPECIEGKAWKLFIKARAGRFSAKPARAGIRAAIGGVSRRIECDPPLSRRQWPRATHLSDLARGTRRTSASAGADGADGNAGGDSGELQRRQGSARRLD